MKHKYITYTPTHTVCARRTISHVSEISAAEGYSHVFACSRDELLLLTFVSSKSSPELPLRGLEGTVMRQLALGSPWALLSTMFWEDMQKSRKERWLLGPSGSDWVLFIWIVFKCWEMARNSLFCSTWKSCHEYMCVHIFIHICVYV